MTHRVSRSQGDRTASLLAESLSIGDEVLDPSLFDVCREFAFDSSSAADFSFFYLRAECMSKFNDGDANWAQTRVENAMSKFLSSELACADANARLVDPWSRSRLNQPVWRRARGIVSRILGSFPLADFPRRCSFGPGASGSLRRSAASHQNKWALSTHITEGALPYYLAFHRWADIGLPGRLTLVDSNKVTTVPKNYKTDRVIAIEPDWNMFFQKGVGELIRQRLQRFGVLLPDAQDKNRALARLGSWTGGLATLDLSNASDSISLGLCEALLPDDWMRVVYDLRSPKGAVGKGTTVTYEKVSSMGNGFTFELETLLFYALACAAGRKEDQYNVSVYGDDIICPTWAVDLTVSVLGEAGFTVNANKSFSEGPFRESCGGHYWRGEDVTPFYLKHHPDTMGDLIVLGNAIVKYRAQRREADLGPFKRVVRHIRRIVPRQLWGPYGCDGVLWSEWDMCRPLWDRDTQSYRQKRITRDHRYLDVSDHIGAYFHKLWTNVPELEASRLPRSLSRERMTTSYHDRDQWCQSPVRLA